jgi:hypothetical protein
MCNSVRIIGVPTQVRAQCLPYTISERYQYVYLLGESMCCHIKCRHFHQIHLKRTALMLRYLNPPPHGWRPAYNPSARTALKTSFFCCSFVSMGTCLFEKPLLSKGCCIFAYLAVSLSPSSFRRTKGTNGRNMLYIIDTVRQRTKSFKITTHSIFKLL